MDSQITARVIGREIVSVGDAMTGAWIGLVTFGRLHGSSRFSGGDDGWCAEGVRILTARIERLDATTVLGRGERETCLHLNVVRGGQTVTWHGGVGRCLEPKIAD